MIFQPFLHRFLGCIEKNTAVLVVSHTSHKLQPCDIGVFGPLKVAYRDQVERLYRGGANTVGKEHFTSLYSSARWGLVRKAKYSQGCISHGRAASYGIDKGGGPCVIVLRGTQAAI